MLNPSILPISTPPSVTCAIGMTLGVSVLRRKILSTLTIAGSARKTFQTSTVMMTSLGKTPVSSRQIWAQSWRLFRIGGLAVLHSGAATIWWVAERWKSTTCVGYLSPLIVL